MLGSSFILSVFQHYITTSPKTSTELSIEQPFVVSDLDRLTGENRMFFSLIGEDKIKAELLKYFPYELKREQFTISFEYKGNVTINDYGRLFLSIDRIYKIFLTFIDINYFVKRWFKGDIPFFNDNDIMQVDKIIKKSPGQVQGTAIGEVARALKDVLSIGKQIEDFRMADVRVEEAKIDLEKKKAELKDQERKGAIKEELAPLDLEIESLKRKLEIEELKTKINEEVRKRGKLLYDDVEQMVNFLGNKILVISNVPEEVLHQLKSALYTEMQEIMGIPIEISDITIKKKK